MELILQGLTKRTHAQALSEMFAGDIVRAILSVAFVSRDGIDHIAALLGAHADKITIYAGIRNEITSAQALKRLIEIGVTTYVVDTGTRNLLFHPKVYHVRRPDEAMLSVGSANLTLGGLNNNIEAGLLAKLSLANQDETEFVNGLEESFDELPGEHPDNVVLMDTDAKVDALLAAGRVIDETIEPPSRTATKAKPGSSDPTPRMKLQAKLLRGKAKPKAPSPQQSAAPQSNVPPGAPGPSATVAPNLELVWESKPLSRRSLTIPTNPNSHPTGSTTLGTGNFNGINRITYFRNYLFGYLNWVLHGTSETADQDFDLVIKGVLVGTFNMTLRHSLTRAAAAPLDHNSPTELAWNDARPLIARDDLLTRTMRLWRSKADPTKFQIEID